MDGTPSEQLAYFEHQVLAARNVERDIGLALCEIKTRKLFQVYGLKFGDYCQSRFDIRKSRAYQLVAFAKACAAAAAAGQVPPANERACREAAARRAGKGSGPAELARLQIILRTAIMAQPPTERASLLHDLQLFLERFAKDLAATQTAQQLAPAAPIPASASEVTRFAPANTLSTTNIDIRMSVPTGAKPPAVQAGHPSASAELSLETMKENSEGRGGITPMTMAQARQLGLA